MFFDTIDVVLFSTFSCCQGVNFSNPLAQSANALAHKNDALLFHQQNCTQLYHHTQLEVTPNFYALCFTLCTRKIIVNLLAQKLLVKWWWNRTKVVLLTSTCQLFHENTKEWKVFFPWLCDTIVCLRGLLVCLLNDFVW